MGTKFAGLNSSVVPKWKRNEKQDCDFCKHIVHITIPIKTSHDCCS